MKLSVVVCNVFWWQLTFSCGRCELRHSEITSFLPVSEVKVVLAQVNSVNWFLLNISPLADLTTLFSSIRHTSRNLDVIF